MQKKIMFNSKQFRSVLLPIKLNLSNYGFKPRKKAVFLKCITFVDGLNPFLYTQLLTRKSNRGNNL